MRDATPPVTVFAEHPLSGDLRDSLSCSPPAPFAVVGKKKLKRDHEDVVGASLNPNSPIANYFSTCLPCYLTPILTGCAGCMWRTPLSIAPRLAPANTRHPHRDDTPRDNSTKCTRRGTNRKKTATV